MGIPEFECWEEKSERTDMVVVDDTRVSTEVAVDTSVEEKMRVSMVVLVTSTVAVGAVAVGIVAVDVFGVMFPSVLLFFGNNRVEQEVGEG